MHTRSEVERWRRWVCCCFIKEPGVLPLLTVATDPPSTLSKAALSLGGFRLTYDLMDAAMDVNMTEEMEEGARTP